MEKANGEETITGKKWKEMDGLREGHLSVVQATNLLVHSKYSGEPTIPECRNTEFDDLAILCLPMGRRRSGMVEAGRMSRAWFEAGISIDRSKEHLHPWGSLRAPGE